MHMKIPDPYAAWMRRLLIVEVVCFLMLFSLGCAGKTAEDAQEAFPLYSSHLSMARYIYKYPHIPRKSAARSFRSLTRM